MNRLPALLYEQDLAEADGEDPQSETLGVSFIIRCFCRSAYSSDDSYTVPTLPVS